MTDKELIERLRFPPMGLDVTVIMFAAAERLEQLTQIKDEVSSELDAAISDELEHPPAPIMKG